ncbi:MAG: DNA polymerase III subunit delta [bacterium]
MLILLCGEDAFRSKQKLNDIIKEYRAKHKSGLNLVRFQENNLEFDKIKQMIEMVSMFDEKKLIILENVFNNKSFQDIFFEYVKKSKLKNNQEVIVVIHHSGKIAISIFKSKLNMLEKFDFLKGNDLVNWIKKQVKKNNAEIDSEAIRKLIAYVGNDLWQMNNEINKLISYESGGIINGNDVDLLVNAKTDINIFGMLDALAQRDKRTALRILHEHLNQGQNEIYLFSMFVYQARVLLRLKDLTEKGLTFYDLAKKSGLHPFVVKKSSYQLRNFTLDHLKKIYQRLLDIEIGIKTGRIDSLTALDLLVAEI